MPDYRSKAFVLRRTNYGESDRILQLITEDGKRSVIARGVRKEKSKLAGGIELLSLTDITAHSGRGDLDILTSARLVEFYSHILEDYDRLQFAYEALKQVSSKSEMIDSADFFTLLAQTLESLNQDAISLKLITTWFHINLARIMGEELNLHTDTNGMKLIEDGLYNYDRESEALAPSPNGTIGPSHIKLLRMMSSCDLKLVAKVTDLAPLLDDCLYLAHAINKR